MSARMSIQMPTRMTIHVHGQISASQMEPLIAWLHLTWWCPVYTRLLQERGHVRHMFEKEKTRIESRMRWNEPARSAQDTYGSGHIFRPEVQQLVIHDSDTSSLASCAGCRRHPFCRLWRSGLCRSVARASQSARSPYSHIKNVHAASCLSCFVSSETPPRGPMNQDRVSQMSLV